MTDRSAYWIGCVEEVMKCIDIEKKDQQTDCDEHSCGSPRYRVVRWQIVTSKRGGEAFSFSFVYVS